MVAFLIVIMMISKNVSIEDLEKIEKISTLGILFLGLVLLEVSYKKDNAKIAMNAIEVIVFGASNLCLIYTIKLFFNNLTNIINYITFGVAGYYILK